jgi:hypothetical protein
VREYKVFINPNGEVEVIKQGWSWPAFFFTFCWMFVKLWGKWGVILLIGYFIFGFMGLIIGADIDKISSILTGIMGIMFMILLGTNGNKISEVNLLSRGFELKTEINEVNRNRAIALYLKEKYKSDRGVKE